MTPTSSTIIKIITDKLLFSDHSSVKSRSSEIVINKNNVGFSIDITGITMQEAEKIREKTICAIQDSTDFEKVNIVLTSKKDEKSKDNAKIHVEGVGKIIVIASGKGGVGKSTITALLAHKLKREGNKVGIIDADIYGPSMPNIFNLSGKPELDDKKMIPLKNYDISINSIGFLTDPEVSISWRGPMVSKALYQLLSLTNWKNLDYLLIDTPPGTGDIHLSLLQNYIIDKAIIVSTPQRIAKIDVVRAMNLYRKFNVPIAGIIENMSNYADPKSENELQIFLGNAGVEISSEYKIPLLAQVAINPKLSSAIDNGDDLNEFSDLLNFEL